MKKKKRRRKNSLKDTEEGEKKNTKKGTEKKTADLSSKLCKQEDNGKISLKCRRKNYRPRILYPANIFSKI